jgi:DNA-binding CsgD family transcriptional regulator/tetratricopeptide (TPR) repeat protein
MAAVVGHAFALAELERIVDELSGEAVLAAVEEAVAAGVLQEAQQTVGRYQFAHALIRETLYDELSTPRRLLQHRRIGEELEGLHARDLDSHLPQLAHHFFEAASTGVGDKAADYCARAGRQAMEMLGYEEAARFFQRALEARELCRPVDQEARCRLLLQLAQALRMGGDTRQALEAFERAASAARRIGSAEALAEAALGLGKPGGHFGLHAEPAVRLLEEALAAQPRDDSSLEVKLLSGLAAGYFLVGRFGEGKTLSRRALEMGRLVGDPSALLAALRAGLAPSDLQAEEVAEYLERTEEMLILAERLGETYALMDAHGYRAQLFLAGGRIEELRAEIEDYPRRAERLRQPAYRCLEPMHAATLATLEGRFEDAERLVVQARLEGERVRFDNVDGIFGIQMFTLRRLQGRLGEVAGAVEHFVASRQAETIWRPGLAVVLTELGQHDRARVELEALSAARFSEVPCDVLWLSSIVFLAEVTCALADREKAAVLYELIRPHGDGYVASGGIATLGAAGQYLGELAGALERWHEAERHFERALDMNRSIGARPWLALTQERYARVLGRRGASGDRERAEGLLQKALATAEEIGMAGLAPVAAAAIDALGRRPPPGHPEGLSRREVEVLRLLAAGWSNRRIAEELHISLNTVATHVRSILSKTDSVNRTEAAAYAIRCGLVEGH